MINEYRSSRAEVLLGKGALKISSKFTGEHPAKCEFALYFQNRLAASVTKSAFKNLLKKVFVFLKICFKVKVFKMFKTFTYCHIKAYRSLKRRSILIIPSIVF